MRANVNKDVCIGCGLCTGIAEDVFRIGDDGKAEAYADTTDSNKASVEDAINSCPVSAISEE